MKGLVPGHKLSKGRPKGAKNKMKGVREALDSLDVDLIGGLIEILPKLSPNKQADVRLKLLEYVHPKLASQEIAAKVTVDKGPSVQITLPSNGREALESVEIGSPDVAGVASQKTWVTDPLQGHKRLPSTEATHPAPQELDVSQFADGDVVEQDGHEYVFNAATGEFE